MNDNQPNSVARTRAIRLDRVCELTGASRSTIWRRVLDDPNFPKPFKLSAGITVWDEGDVFSWIAAKKNAVPKTNAPLAPKAQSRHSKVAPGRRRLSEVPAALNAGGRNVDRA
jgi:predicted DNA-binding transcriptional regulator AlpA